MTLRTAVVLITGAAGLVALTVWATAQQPAERPRPAAAAPVSPEETAIRQTIASYVKAFNLGDATALGTFWTEDAEYFGDEGASSKGRAAITERFKALFAEKKGLVMTGSLTSVKLLGPSAALVDGTVTLTDPKGGTDTSPFESAWVKGADGRWVLSRVRDLSDIEEKETNFEHLKPLEWLVGEWTGESAAMSVTLSCRLEKNRNFLVLDQAVKVAGKDVISVTKYIGWDAAEGHLRSWVFDSEGGFGSGEFSRTGNEWTEVVEFRNRGGTDGSAKNVWLFVDDNHFEWKAVEREVDGRPVGDVAVKYVRKAAK
jgi:uncharacterized protein (TIGR02246 family)